MFKKESGKAESKLRTTRGGSSANLQVAIMYARHVRSQHSLGLPLKMNGMHTTQSDHVRFDLSRETYAKHSVGQRTLFPSINLSRTESLASV